MRKQSLRTVVTAALLTLIGCAQTHTVQEGRFYRVNQLSADKLREVLEAEQIKTVINLNGFHPDAEWYRQQRAQCTELGVEHHDVTLNPAAPDREEMLQLLELYHHAPGPILVQGDGKSGAVGLASGMYRLAAEGQTTRVALQELSWWQSPLAPTWASKRPAQLLANWRGEYDFLETYHVADQPDRPLLLPSHSALGPAELAVLKPAPEPPSEIVPTAKWTPAGGESILGRPKQKYASSTVGAHETGVVYTDYSALIVDQPVSANRLVGRTPAPSAASTSEKPAAINVELGAPMVVPAPPPGP